MTHLDRILQQRGILETAREMGWKPDRDGWLYPVFDFSGQVVAWRWKNKNSSAKTKYFWKEGNAKYYHAPDLLTAIAAAGGVLYIANGEASVLAYLAAGIRNVLCWFGEASVPETLLADLRAMGVTRAIYAPDKDNTGLTSAAKVRDLLAGSGIHFQALRLPDNLPAKADFNDLWINVQFVPVPARDALDNLTELDLPAPETPIVIAHRAINYSQGQGRGRIDWKRLLIDVLAHFVALPSWKRSGKQLAGRSPFREDKRQSAWINLKSGKYRDAATGEAYKLYELAERIGFNLDDYRNQPPRPTKSRRKSATSLPQTAARDTEFIEFPEPLTRAREGTAGEEPLKLLPTANARLEPFTAHVKQDAPYVNQLPYIRGLMKGTELPTVLVLKSATGTGKTQFVVDLLQARSFRRVLYLTLSETLTIDANERLKATGRDFVRYADLPPDLPLYMADSVVCSLDSLHRLAGGLPYDLVIFDESAQNLPHFAGKTMQYRYTPNWQTISDIFSHAGHVIAMDAQQSDLAAHWVETLTKRAAFKVENTHRQPNTLTLHTEHAHLLAAVAEAVEANQGPVVFTTASRREARQMMRYFARRLPAGQVKTIHGGNSQQSGIREFVRNINTELPSLRLLVASPAVATGIDVTALVHAVFGSFGSPTSPNNWLQQLRRYRRAGQYHATIRAGNSESVITDPDILRSMERGKARATRDLARFDDFNVPVATLAQADITRLWADFTAAANRQRMQPVSYFVALAQHEGFTVYEDDRAAPAGAVNTFKANRDALKAEDDHLTLTLEPVSSSELDKRRRAGSATEADMLANLRWKIEDTTGATISTELLERYRTPADRAALRRFTDYTMPFKTSQVRDREEAALLPFKRGHHTLHRTILDDMIQALWGEQGLENTARIPALELESRLAPVIAKHRRSIQELDRRTDLSPEAIPILRRVMAWFGLTISSKQIRMGNERVMVYWIDRDNLAYIQAAAERRRAYLEAQRERESKLSKITETTIYKRDFRHPPTLPVSEPPKPAAPPDFSRFSPAAFPDRRPARGLQA